MWLAIDVVLAAQFSMYYGRSVGQGLKEGWFQAGYYRPLLVELKVVRQKAGIPNLVKGSCLHPAAHTP